LTKLAYWPLTKQAPK